MCKLTIFNWSIIEKKEKKYFSFRNNTNKKINKNYLSCIAVYHVESQTADCGKLVALSDFPNIQSTILVPGKIANQIT